MLSRIGSGNDKKIVVSDHYDVAVVCDAEQIIYSQFDRQNQSKIDCLPGSIENAGINVLIVNVLEGTMPAFNNRKIKYH
ncbi:MULTISPECIES: hypothetical protein [unclassified Leptospira]|uniref:hypothetical protein n=1 Tax=unclassified Leptospira TaxID=2633828 RepID=UPI0002BDE87B|nr:MULTISPECIES: hypothetical protein [unclassified Leptospira]EMK01239.1 hypothetical protein LEP1GSC192_1163 [Leptospira sp. B5-022]MCR1795842.1 hypothetical protein [Leptospira sp. id769339]